LFHQRHADTLHHTENRLLTTSKHLLGVLVGATLPGAVRVGDVDFDAGVGTQLLGVETWTIPGSS
ncbi:hypothetical protein, partial [Amycolatopsis jiangsuensis]|uniref:hypothetical protein n=1 Tax=Amycolatopsis jiangsuensis TaxID=1181879 RepID=UPI00363A7DFF